MGIGSKFSEGCSILEQISAASRTAGTVTSGWMKSEAQVPLAFLINIGAIATGGTFDCKLEQATSSAGAGAKDLKSASQLTDTEDDMTKILEAINSELDLANSYTHVRLSCTVAGAAVLYGAHALKFWNRIPSASGMNGTNVDEVV